ncbi:nuclease-related domain-containing protein [Pectobacterium aroidearum]|uniref:nuclease-related domain-containing protein n=1 Tax=Pectobacterium aroidearum TaxID=1201031 RepID=UPI002FC658E7
MSKFRSWAQSKSSKKPTQRGFDINKWRVEWEENGEGYEDEQLYKAVEFTWKALKKVRNDISLYFEIHAPDKITYNQVLVLLIAYANRFFIIHKMHTLSARTDNDVNFITGIQYPNLETNDEIAHSVVDSLQSAIDYCSYSINQGTNLKAGKEPQDKDEFITGLINLSSAYSFFEGFFWAFLYGSFNYLEEGSCHFFREDNNEFNIANREAQYRKLKDIFSEIQENKFSVNFFPDVYSFELKKEGRGKVFKKLIANSEQKILYYFNCLSLNKVFDQYDNKKIDDVIKKYNFTKKELIKVFSSISLFSESHVNSKSTYFSMNINFHSSSFKRVDFCQILSQATCIDYCKVSSIIDFLTFNEGKGKDLWAFPLIKIDNNCIAVIVPASIAPMPQRVGEFWIKSMGLNETSKGKKYETKIIELLKEHLNKNAILSNKVEVFGPIELIGDAGKEEIDLLIYIDNKIILIDIKCISSIDSPVSEWNSLCKIKHGASQVIRKAEFFNHNKKTILRDLKIDSIYDCEVYPYVLVSNLSLNGVQIDSVPIIDADILISYFSSGKLDMLQLNGKSYVKINLYNDLHEAALNFDRYFKNPFQTNFSFDLYKSKNINYDFGLDKKIIVERLVRKDISINDVISKISKVDNFETYIDKEIFSILEQGGVFSI